MKDELSVVIARMDKNLEMRHTYLMFAYTTSAVLLAALFAIESFESLYWLCMLPYAVIIPFQARISYSRISHSRMEAYVKIFYKEDFKFYNRYVDELQGVGGKIIAILSNYELTLLSIEINICFYALKFRVNGAIDFRLVSSYLPIAMTLIVAGLAKYTRNYAKFVSKFEAEYRNLDDKSRKKSN